MKCRECDAKAWIKKLDKVLKAMPEGIEAHVGYSSVTVYLEGRMKEHMEGDMNGFGINDRSEIACIDTDCRLIPYSEGH